MKGSAHRWPAALAALGFAGLAAAQTPPANTFVDYPDMAVGFTAMDGQQLYAVICQACHMPDGKGAKGAGMFPALANNPKLVSPVYPGYVVLRGLRGMPSFARGLSDAQVAAVVNYVITHFGNHADELATEADVKALRQAEFPASGEAP